MIVVLWLRDEKLYRGGKELSGAYFNSQLFIYCFSFSVFKRKLVETCSDAAVYISLKRFSFSNTDSIPKVQVIIYRKMH